MAQSPNEVRRPPGVVRAGRKARGAARRASRALTLEKLLPEAYLKAAQEPVDPKLAVFIEATSETPSNSLAEMYQVLRDDYGFEVRFFSLGLNRVSRARLYANVLGIADQLAHARFIIICDASEFIGCLPLRDETDVIQLWHGCGAFKKFGMSTADKKFGENRAAKLRYPLYANTSLVTVSSAEVKWAYLEAMSLEETPDIVQPFGSSRTDVFFDQQFLDAQAAEALKIVPAIEGKKVIGYAPTFRGRVAAAQGPDELDLRLLKQRLGDDYVLLIKHHPHVVEVPPIPVDCQDFAFQVTDTMSIETLMCVSDICISDYSSLVFEYSLFERPMIFFAYDVDNYGSWRGFYYDYAELTPGPVVKTTEEVVDYIEHVDDRFDVEEVRTFKERFMGACDGHATRRICDAMIGGTLPARLSGQVEVAKQVARQASAQQRPTVSHEAHEVARKIVRPAWVPLRRTVTGLGMAPALQAAYDKAAREPLVEGSVLFFDEKAQSFPVAFAQVKKEIEDTYQLPTSYVGLKVIDNSWKTVARKCVATMGQLATAEYVFLQDASVVLGAVRLRPETKVIQLWHEAGLYTERHADAYDRFLDHGRELQTRHDRHPYYGLVTTSAPEVDESFVRHMGAMNKGAVLPIGVSATDPFMDEQFVSASTDKVRELVPAAKDRRIIVYAPTFRGGRRDAKAPAELDIHDMRRALGDSYVLLIRHDPLVAWQTPIPFDCQDFAFYPGKDISTEELLAAADVAIFDYSNTYCLYALLERPMVFFAYDRETFLEYQGVSYDYEQVVPGPVVAGTGEIVDFVQNLEVRFDVERVRSFKRRYLSSCDGNATRRICDLVFG